MAKIIQTAQGIADTTTPLQQRLARVEHPVYPVMNDVANLGLFQNGWVNFGSPEGRVTFYDTGLETVVTGTVKSGTLNTIAFRLPATLLQWDGQKHVFSADSNGAYGAIVLDGYGNIIPALGSNAAFRLELRFRHI